VVVVVLSDPFRRIGRGGTPRRPNSRATPQGLDQRAKIEEVVPKMARRIFQMARRIKDFASFIAMTLITARKTITAVFGTMVLQLIKVFQCSVTYSMKQTSSFFWLLQWFHWFYCVWLQLNARLQNLLFQIQSQKMYLLCIAKQVKYLSYPAKMQHFYAKEILEKGHLSLNTTTSFGER